MGLNLYKIPSNEILHKRIEFYDLKRGIGETVEQWLNRVQSSILSCTFPTITNRFLLIDRFICGLSRDEMQIIERAGTWSTLKQLMAMFADQEDGPSRNRDISVDTVKPVKVCVVLIYVQTQSKRLKIFRMTTMDQSVALQTIDILVLE